jgi:hypothetical protein
VTAGSKEGGLSSRPAAGSRPRRISLRTLGGDRAGEVRLDRFLKNPRVTPAEMVATARSHLLERVQEREVLVIQDTTSLRDDGNKRGLYLHPAIVVDAADGALLGLLSADLLVRDETPKAHCNKRRLGEKESRRWVDATAQAADLLAAGASRVTVIADREADLYEMFACRPEGIDVLVRANHNRAGLTRVATSSRNWAARRSNCRPLPAARRAWRSSHCAPDASASSGLSAIVRIGRRRWRPVSSLPWWRCVRSIRRLARQRCIGGC